MLTSLHIKMLYLDVDLIIYGLVLMCHWLLPCATS